MMDVENNNPVRSDISNIISGSRIGPILASLFILFAFSVCFAHADSKYYSIQIGAYKNKNNAVKEVSRLRQMGHDAFIRQISTTADQTLYLVYFEKYYSKVSAENAALKAKKQGLIGEYVIKDIDGGVHNDTGQRDQGHKSYYGLHVASFKRGPDAAKEIQRLKEKGHEAFVKRTTIDGKQWHRIYIGGYDDRHEAESAGSKLKSQGIISYYRIKKFRPAEPSATAAAPNYENPAPRTAAFEEKTDPPKTFPTAKRRDKEMEKGRGYYDFGVFAFESGDYALAEENFKQALAYNPNHPFYNHYLGKTYLKQRRYEAAGKHLQSAWDSNPDIPELKYDFAFLNYKTATYSRAADLFSEISEETPSNVLAQYYAGICLYQRERYDQALGYFLSTAQKSPSLKVNSYYYAGVCYLMSGETDKAVSLLVYVKDTAESELLQNNASNWLRSIEKYREKHRETRKRYSLYLKLGSGYDSNVPLEPINQDFFADEDDYFAVGYFSGKYDVVSQARYRIGAGYSHYQKMYRKLTDFDLTASIFDLYGTYLFHPFMLKLGYVPTYYWLGSDSWLRQHQIIPELNWRVNKDLVGTLAYRFSQNTYFQDSDWNGHTNDVFANAYYQPGARRVSLFGGAGYEINNADTADQDWGLFTARLGASFQLPGELTSSVSLRFIDKRFDNEDSFYGKKRHDLKYGGYINLYRELYADWLGIDLQYDYIKTDSNIDDFDYKRSVVTLSLKSRF